MRTLSIATSIMLHIIFLSCNNNSTQKTETNAEHGAIQPDSLAMQNEHPPSEDETRNEFEKLDTLVRDTLRIRYNNIIDTIYGRRDGRDLIFDGDIKFRHPISSGMGHTQAVATSARKWRVSQDTIIIPYIIRDQNKTQEIIRAIEEWESKARIKFVQRTFQPDYIEFIPSRYTRSYVGKVGGRQTIELADWATWGNTAHEIGHALGLFHEHTRSDRDEYITIDRSCLGDINYMHAFRHDPSAVDIGPYNYGSIMHYGRNTGCFIIRRSISPNIKVGQRDSVTYQDYTAIERIHGIN